MRLSNFHSHSDFCDGSGKPEDYIKEAIEQGFSAYGFSSHAPISFEKDWTLAEEDLPLYLEEIARLKDIYSKDIEIYTGLEIDYIEGLSGPTSEKFLKLPLDYCIGSVHMIKSAVKDKYLAIDGPESHLKELMEESYHGSFEKLSNRYYELVREMIGKGQFQILGHLDLVKKRNRGDVYFSEEKMWYKDQVMETLETLAGTGIFLEINTGGISRGAIDSIYPSPWILKEAKRKNIPIMLNSDSHVPDHISFYYSESLEIAKDCGYRELHTISKGEWISYPLEI